MASDISNRDPVEQRDPVEVLGEEFLARRRRGEDPQIHQYIAANRQYADRISALFPAMIAMEDLKAIKDASNPGAQRSGDLDGSSDRPIRLHVDRLERLGDFRIIREIGHGGMGIVYEAEQQSLRRRVAVKVFPKQAIGDSSQLKRFQREAETAGGLHHTNIVPVFGVGQQNGLHYFVMQFIDGISLDALIVGMKEAETEDVGEGYIQEIFHRLRSAATSTPAGCPTHRDGDTGDQPGSLDGSIVPLRESDVVDPKSVRRRVRSFGANHWRRIADMGAEVADALQYAHSQGVMHRDIKPSNLILGSDSRVWVTDFGLAVTHQQERLSRSGDVVGTLRYMSPEQLHGGSDERSDVYGLGLTLYEMTTLRPAFEGESRGSLIRKVSSSSPPPPRLLRPEIPKDLETIILKAIARAPESRYKTAAEFADDLRRFRDDRPVRARRIGPGQRLSRWSRRNPALAGTSFALAFCLIFSFAAIGWNWHQAIIEKQHAESEGARAENNLSLALGSMDRLLEKFESDWMSHPVASDAGPSETETEFRFVVSDHSAVVLEEALVFYDQFAEANANNPKLELETAKAYRRAGDLLDRLGRYDDAEQAYRRSAEAMTTHVGRDDSDAGLVAETADALNRLAVVLHRLDRSKEAKQELDTAKEMLSDQLARGESPDCLYQLALTNSNLGLVLWRMHQGEDSTLRHRRAILLLEGLAEVNPLESKYRLSLARAYRNYYPIALVCKERVYSSEIRASAAGILEQLVADFPGVPDYRCELSEMLAIAPTRGGEPTAQRSHDIDRAVHLADQLNRDFQSIPRYQTALARSLGVQATLVRGTDPTRAGEIHQRAIGLLRQLRSRFPDVAAYRGLLARALRDQGVTLRKLNRGEAAICSLEEAVSEQAVYLELRPDTVYGRKAMSTHLRVLAESLQQAGDTHRAEEAIAHAAVYWKPRPTEETDPSPE